MTKTALLGDEYDDGLRRQVLAALRSMGAVAVDDVWGIGGSQEWEQVRVSLDGRELILEAETYVGLQISGDDELVDRVVATIEAADRASR